MQWPLPSSPWIRKYSKAKRSRGTLKAKVNQNRDKGDIVAIAHDVENAWKEDEEGPLNCLPPGGPWRPRVMSTNLTTCEWKKVFYEKMEVAKPADSWELIIDPNLKPNELAPGWKQYLEQHASGRFHCSWCWHTWQSPHVVILFHMHLDRDQRMGSVRMRVFKQLCYECGMARQEESSMLEENIESLVDNLISSLREQCYDEDGGQYRIHVASRPDSGPHLSEFCEACQEGIVHWKPSQKLLEEEATYTSGASKPMLQEGSGYSFFSLRWCLFWASLCLLIVYLQVSLHGSVFL